MSPDGAPGSRDIGNTDWRQVCCLFVPNVGIDATSWVMYSTRCLISATTELRTFGWPSR